MRYLEDFGEKFAVSGQLKSQPMSFLPLLTRSGRDGLLTLVSFMG